MQLIFQKFEKNKDKNTEHGNSTSQITKNQYYLEHNKNINQQDNEFTIVLLMFCRFI